MNDLDKYDARAQKPLSLTPRIDIVLSMDSQLVQFTYHVCSTS